MARTELFHFEYFDPIRKRWLRARFVSTRERIEKSYPQHRLVGEPEIREGPDEPKLGMGYSRPRD